MSEPNANAIPSTRAANRSRTHKLTISAMLSGVAFLLMFIEFPIPALIPSFVKLDVSDLPELLAAFSLGPVYGIVVTFLKNLLFSVLHGTSSAYVGEVFNFVMGSVFSFSAGYIYSTEQVPQGRSDRRCCRRALMRSCLYPSTTSWCIPPMWCATVCLWTPSSVCIRLFSPPPTASSSA